MCYYNFSFSSGRSIVSALASNAHGPLRSQQQQQQQHQAALKICVLTFASNIVGPALDRINKLVFVQESIMVHYKIIQVNRRNSREKRLKIRLKLWYDLSPDTSYFSRISNRVVSYRSNVCSLERKICKSSKFFMK